MSVRKNQSSIHRSAEIAKTARIGVPYRPLLTGAKYQPERQTKVNAGVFVGEYAIIGEGAHLGSSCIIDHFCIIEPEVTIGSGTLVCYRAQVCSESQIDSDCVIGGYIGERSKISRGARVFGSLVHNHPRNFAGWDDDDSMQSGPRIGSRVFIGFGAVIVGSISIGNGSYIGANAVVCVDIPENGSVKPNYFKK